MPWVDGQYNSSQAVLGRTLVLSVYWDAMTPKGENRQNGYIVKVGNRSLKQLASDMDTAKKQAIMLAERVLMDCQNDLQALKGS